MTSIYDRTISNAASIISKTSDRELPSNGYNQKVFNSAKISTPKLHLDQTNVEIKQEQVSFKNIPPGIGYSQRGSHSVEYAIYCIPVSGDMEIFTLLVKPYINRQTTYVDDKNLYYKEYSNSKISGNDELINQIKNRVVGFTTSVNTILTQFENEVNNFHETTLKPKIDELIKLEIAKRNLISDAVSKLNPFS